MTYKTEGNIRGASGVVFDNLTLTLRGILTMRSIHMNLLKKEENKVPSFLRRRLGEVQYQIIMVKVP